jgi:signal transduction histidine kinase
MLHDFIETHRRELIERTRAKVALRALPGATDHELEKGVPLFLTQLGHVLASEAAHSAPDGTVMDRDATAHGSELLQKGFSISQVVHNYGDVCQAITELAVERGTAISTEDFQTLNRCLDDSIAHAVTEHARQTGADNSAEDTRRHGFFAHELRNHLSTAMLAFEVVKSGRVGVTGSTIEVLGRSLRGLRDLVDRSLIEVRLAAGLGGRQRLSVADFIEEMKSDSLVSASDRVSLQVEAVDPELAVLVDGHLFASAISNLLQNAFKFTRHPGQVCLRARSSGDRVLIEVEDGCGGLPPAAEKMFRPFEQMGSTRGGLGLGLTIAQQAIEANGGTLSLRNIPGKGCVFIVELPLAEDDPKATISG